MKKISALRFLALLCLLFNAHLAYAELSAPADWMPLRRKEQFPTAPGYAVLPIPYSLPGLGSGFALGGGLMNIADTTTDLYGVAITGDVQGMAVGAAQMPVIKNHLLVDAGYSNISAASFRAYRQRGMDSDKDQYNTLEAGGVNFYGSRWTATFLQRRLEFYAAYYEGVFKPRNLRDRDGNLVASAENASEQKAHSTLMGIRLDFTDEYDDPRRGVRLTMDRTYKPRYGTSADFYQQDASLTGYVPMGVRSTLALNAFQSDAIVTSEGITSATEIQNNLGVNCSSNSLSSTAQASCTDYVNNVIASNRYGTATSLGGFSRLRSFPQNRFNGAHSAFVGAEFRWNITEETKPFDIIIMRDVRTVMQLAFFAESGTVAEHQSDLWKQARQSYGVGFRLLTASGFVFRADVATGNEGVQPVVFIGYPWEL